MVLAALKLQTLKGDTFRHDSCDNLLAVHPAELESENDRIDEGHNYICYLTKLTRLRYHFWEKHSYSNHHCHLWGGN